jgi:hypothetical protein
MAPIYKIFFTDLLANWMLTAKTKLMGGILMVFSCFVQYYFEERYNLVRFIKTIQKVGMFVHLRIGPYISGEWISS